MDKSIPDNVRTDFNLSGLAHILAVSGANLTVIAGMAVLLGRAVFGRRHNIYLWLAAGTIVIYTLPAGAEPPVVRGAVMGGIFLLAEGLGRQKSAGHALALAAAIMMAFDPNLLWSASFLLSFGSMAGLIVVYPLLRQWLSRVFSNLPPNALGSAAPYAIDAMVVSAAAMAGIWPLTVYYF